MNENTNNINVKIQFVNKEDIELKMVKKYGDNWNEIKSEILNKEFECFSDRMQTLFKNFLHSYIVASTFLYSAEYKKEIEKTVEIVFNNIITSYENIKEITDELDDILKQNNESILSLNKNIDK